MKQLVNGLHQFQTRYFSSHQSLFEQLSQGQKPRILFITCSDSRIDPNLITQSQVGDLFVIRNAGNLIPPYGATNGGEGAAVEYAIQALGIEQIIVCGHSHCGAMKGLLKLSALEEEMPLVYEWLKQAEATRRLIKESYSTIEGEQLLDITIAENVLTQIENLRTYPVIHSKLHQGKLHLHAWVYHIETGEVLEYDPVRYAFVPPDGQVEASLKGCTITQVETIPSPALSAIKGSDSSSRSADWLSAKQAERIYRGSF
ncbi:MAG: carbonic anhydrase [Geitlerinemataceae cyanobacterium]